MGGITLSSSLCLQLIPLYSGSSVNIHVIYYIVSNVLKKMNRTHRIQLSCNFDCTHIIVVYQVEGQSSTDVYQSPEGHRRTSLYLPLFPWTPYPSFSLSLNHPSFLPSFFFLYSSLSTLNFSILLPSISFIPPCLHLSLQPCLPPSLYPPRSLTFREHKPA